MSVGYVCLCVDHSCCLNCLSIEASQFYGDFSFSTGYGIQYLFLITRFCLSHIVLCCSQSVTVALSLPNNGVFV